MLIDDLKLAGWNSTMEDCETTALCVFHEEASGIGFAKVKSKSLVVILVFWKVKDALISGTGRLSYLRHLSTLFNSV